MKALSLETCPHHSPMGECSALWCRSRLADHSAPVDFGKPDPSTDKLITHMARYYSDWHIVHDLDCVLSECQTPEGRQRVERYAAARKAADDFDPRSHEDDRRHNSHQPWMNPAVMVGDSAAHCGSCGGPMGRKRSTKRFCSEACKKRAKRQKALVSL